MMHNAQKVLEVLNLQVRFPVKQNSLLKWVQNNPPLQIKAVENVSFSVFSGEVLGIVGESGCGKSSLARALVGLNSITAGDVVWYGQSIKSFSREDKKKLASKVQMVFQDPFASLNSRMTAGDLIAEPLITHCPTMKKEMIRKKVLAMMEEVGLLPSLINRYPHQFSGGQCQRIGIARALILEPKIIILDEPISALDVSIKAQIINLLKKIQKKTGVTFIVIAHDLAVMRYLCDRIVVMYLGQIMEVNNSEALFQDPKHPYTKALMDSILILDSHMKDKPLAVLKGELPSPLSPPKGCVFSTRCPYYSRICNERIPDLIGDEQHKVACLKLNHL